MFGVLLWSVVVLGALVEGVAPSPAQRARTRRGVAAASLDHSLERTRSSELLRGGKLVEEAPVTRSDDAARNDITTGTKGTVAMSRPAKSQPKSAVSGAQKDKGAPAEDILVPYDPRMEKNWGVPTFPKRKPCKRIKIVYPWKPEGKDNVTSTAGSRKTITSTISENKTAGKDVAPAKVKRQKMVVTRTTKKPISESKDKEKAPEKFVSEKVTVTETRLKEVPLQKTEENKTSQTSPPPK